MAALSVLNGRKVGETGEHCLQKWNGKGRNKRQQSIGVLCVACSLFCALEEATLHVWLNMAAEYSIVPSEPTRGYSTAAARCTPLKHCH